MRKLVNLLFALILAISLFLPFSYPAQAATESETVASEGTLLGGSYNGGALNFTNLNDSNDGTSLVFTTVYGIYYHTYNMTDFTAPLSSIVSVTINARIYATTPGYMCLIYRSAGGSIYRSSQYAPGGAFAAVSYVWNTCPATGVAWTANDINNGQFGIESYSDGSMGTLISELSITTTYLIIVPPIADTLAASAVSSNTARLNGTITDYGNQLCDVQFICDNVTNATWAAFLADNGTVGHDVHISTLVSNTYNTGDFPYADITGLNNGQTYYFTDNITNDAGSVIGTVRNFTTASGISDCTNFIAVPSATTISYSWTKGTGGNMSLLRYSSAAYPPTITDGTAGYLGTGNSVQITGLTPGTTYYASLWATTGGLYSSIAGVHALATTLAYDTTTGSSIDTPAANPQFLQTPDATKMANVPLLGGPTGLIQANSDAYGTPVNMLWYLFWMVTGAGAGIVIYNRTSYNLVATCAVDAIWFSVGAALGLTMMWIVVVFLVIAAGFTMFGNRH